MSSVPALASCWGFFLHDGLLLCRFPPRDYTILMCNFFFVSVWEYVESSISLSILASGETRRQASIAAFANSCSQRCPVASKQDPTQPEWRVGISQPLQKRDAMETSCLDGCLGSSICHWNIYAATYCCQLLLPCVLHAY